MATMTLPRVATYKINYSTGEAWTQGADAAVYCSAKYKNMAQWQYDLTALQAERAGREIIITRATVAWQTSARYTYDIRVQDARCYGRGAGAYLGDAKGSSTNSHWISTSRNAPHDSIALIQDAINGGATAIYVSCQNESTSASGYGACQYGTFTIEYEYATPQTIIDYLVADRATIALGESVNVTASVRNITAAEISAVQMQAVREADGADVAVGDPVTVDVSIPAAETALIHQALTIPAWANAARATQLYVRVSIADKDAEKAALCTALNRRYSPAIDIFNVYRAKKNIADDNWVRNENGIHTLTDLKIALDDGTTGFHLYVYYSTGLPDITSASNRIDLTDMLSSAKSGIENALAIVDTVSGWSLDSEWRFAVVLTDGYESARADAEIGRAFTNVHFAGLATGGVRFGGYCTRSTQDNPAFECDYPIYAYGGIAEMDYSTAEMKTAARWIDGKPVYRKVFNVTGNPIQLANGYYYTFPAIEGIDAPINMHGYWKRSNQDGAEYMSIPFAMETDLHYWVTVSLNTSGNPYLRFSYPYSDIIHIVLIMEYTKGE